MMTHARPTATCKGEDKTRQAGQRGSTQATLRFLPLKPLETDFFFAPKVRQQPKEEAGYWRLRWPTRSKPWAPHQDPIMLFFPPPVALLNPTPPIHLLLGACLAQKSTAVLRFLFLFQGCRWHIFLPSFESHKQLTCDLQSNKPLLLRLGGRGEIGGRGGG